MGGRDLASRIWSASLAEHTAKALLAFESVVNRFDARSNLARLWRSLHTLRSDAEAAGRRSVARVLGEVELAVLAARKHRDFVLETAVVEQALVWLRDIHRSELDGIPAPNPSESLVARARQLGAFARDRLRGDRIRPA